MRQCTKVGCSNVAVGIGQIKSGGQILLTTCRLHTPQQIKDWIDGFDDSLQDKKISELIETTNATGGKQNA